MQRPNTGKSNHLQLWADVQMRCRACKKAWSKQALLQQTGRQSHICLTGCSWQSRATIHRPGSAKELQFKIGILRLQLSAQH